MLVMIGSTALRMIGVDIKREPQDLDIVGSYDEVMNYLKQQNCHDIYPIDDCKKLVGKSDSLIIEAEITTPNSSAEQLYNLVLSTPDHYLVHNMIYPPLDVLYLLKMTHRFKKNSPHFTKTMRDIQRMRIHGAKIRPEHRDFYNARKAETLNYKHPKLNQNKKDFFTDDVPYIFDHDTIHQAVKLYAKPAYSYFKPDEAEVLTSKKMFDALPHEMKLAAVYEESCVLALERSQIPYPKTDQTRSFAMALMKVCTSITSGWFRTFAWENYDDVIKLYVECQSNGYGYVKSFLHGLDSGVVKLHGNRN